MTLKKAATVACVTLGLLASGCSQGPGTAISDATTQPPTPATATSGAMPEGSAVPAEHRALVDTFVAAINRGDETAVGDTFASTAVFDSVGRIYQGREEIMDRFLIPEVIRAGGQYTLLSLTAGQNGRVIAEYDFSTSSGGREHFTYDCEVNAGRFADCVGRYV